MADPIRFITYWSGMRGYRPMASAVAAQRDPLSSFQFAAEIIARHELHIWFEPDWHLAQRLARRFPHCLVCSIPVESNTEAIRRVPAWRRQRDVGVV